MNIFFDETNYPKVNEPFALPLNSSSVRCKWNGCLLCTESPIEGEGRFMCVLREKQNGLRSVIAPRTGVKYFQHDFFCQISVAYSTHAFSLSPKNEKRPIEL